MPRKSPNMDSNRLPNAVLLMSPAPVPLKVEVAQFVLLREHLRSETATRPGEYRVHLRSVDVVPDDGGALRVRGGLEPPPRARQFARDLAGGTPRMSRHTVSPAADAKPR